MSGSFNRTGKSEKLDFSENSRRFSYSISSVGGGDEYGNVLHTVKTDFIAEKKFCIAIDYEIETGRIGGAIQFSFCSHQKGMLNLNITDRLASITSKEEDIKYLLSGIRQFEELYKPLPSGECDIRTLSNPSDCVSRISHKMYSSRILLACLNSALFDEGRILHKIADSLGFSSEYIEKIPLSNV